MKPYLKNPMGTAQESGNTQCEYIMSCEWLDDLKKTVGNELQKKVTESDPMKAEPW